MKNLKENKDEKLHQVFSNDEIQNFNFEIQGFKEEEDVKGKFSGLLVNMTTNTSAKGLYRFKKGSMKMNNGKKLFLQYNHYGNILPIGTLMGEETEKGFEVIGQFHLSKDDNGNYMNPEAVKLYSLMKEMKINFEMSVGGVITEYKEVIENGKLFIDIYKFDAYEGSLTPRAAVKGSKVTKIFNENIGGKKMNKEELTLLLTGLLAEFKNELLTAGTSEEIKELPTKFKEIVDKFDGFKEELGKELREDFSKQINEINEVIKGLKADFKASPQEVSIAEQFAAMIQEVERNGKAIETVFTGESEVKFADPATTVSHKAGVKTQYVNTILERIAEINPVLEDIKFITITDGSLTIPREVAGLPEVAWIGETVERGETENIKLDQVNVVLYQIYVMPKITNKLLATNFVGYANFLIKRLEYALSLKIADTLFNGTGENMPTGILNDKSVKNVQELDNTNDTALVDSLIDAYYAVDEVVARNAKWYLTPETWARVAKLKNERKDFYITDLNNGNTRTIMQRPVRLITSKNAGIKGIDKASATEVVGVFADLGMAVVGIQNNSMSLRLEDKITSKGFTKYYIEKGVGMGIQLPEYILKLVKKA